MASAYRRQDNFSLVDHLVLVSGAQNITACENQGKQRELSDHWNLKKNKKRKKHKKIDWNTSFNKKVYESKRKFKKAKVTVI